MATYRERWERKVFELNKAMDLYQTIAACLFDDQGAMRREYLEADSAAWDRVADIRAELEQILLGLRARERHFTGVRPTGEADELRNAVL